MFLHLANLYLPDVLRAIKIQYAELPYSAFCATLHRVFCFIDYLTFSHISLVILLVMFAFTSGLDLEIFRLKKLNKCY
jgi:hypothetical protein